MPRVEFLIFVWMVSFVVYTLRTLGNPGKAPPFVSSFSVSVGDSLFSVLAFSLMFTCTIGAAWMSAWWMYATEVRSTTEQCAVESNPPPGEVAEGSAGGGGGSSSSRDDQAEARPGVLIASLEHVVPCARISVTAGGLGKVLRMQLLHAMHTPQRGFFFVFPMVEGVDYSSFAEELQPLQGGTVRVLSLRDPACDNIHFVRAEPHSRAPHPLSAPLAALSMISVPLRLPLRAPYLCARSLSVCVPALSLAAMAPPADPAHRRRSPLTTRPSPGARARRSIRTHAVASPSSPSSGCGIGRSPSCW